MWFDVCCLLGCRLSFDARCSLLVVCCVSCVLRCARFVLLGLVGRVVCCSLLRACLWFVGARGLLRGVSWLLVVCCCLLCVVVCVLFVVVCRALYVVGGVMFVGWCSLFVCVVHCLSCVCCCLVCVVIC